MLSKIHIYQKLKYSKLRNTMYLERGEAFKNALIEKIEDEYDIALAEHVHNELLKNPTTYSLEEVNKELGL